MSTDSTRALVHMPTKVEAYTVLSATSMSPISTTHSLCVRFNFSTRLSQTRQSTDRDARRRARRKLDEYDKVSCEHAIPEWNATAPTDGSSQRGREQCWSGA